VGVVKDAGTPFVSGEAVALDVRVARIGSRMLSFLIDLVVQVVLVWVLMIAAVFGLSTLDRFAEIDNALVSATLIACLIIAFIGYPVLVTTLTRGRSLGKLALGLRVVRDDGGPIRFRHAFTRTLVGVAVDWPGLILPPFTWVTCVWTMLVNRDAKRLGDLAAGTIVIHERTPESWGWVPAMPPPLRGWAAALDLSGLDDELALAVRHYLSRNRRIGEPYRSQLGQALAAEVAACTTPPPPPGAPGWAYLAAVLAERHRRAVALLAARRAASAQVWPELLAPRPALRGTALATWSPPAPAGPPPLRPGVPRA